MELLRCLLSARSLRLSAMTASTTVDMDIGFDEVAQTTSTSAAGRRLPSSFRASPRGKFLPSTAVAVLLDPAASSSRSADGRDRCFFGPEICPLSPPPSSLSESDLSLDVDFFLVFLSIFFLPLLDGDEPDDVAAAATVEAPTACSSSPLDSSDPASFSLSFSGR